VREGRPAEAMLIVIYVYKYLSNKICDYYKNNNEGLLLEIKVMESKTITVIREGSFQIAKVSVSKVTRGLKATFHIPLDIYTRAAAVSSLTTLCRRNQATWQLLLPLWLEPSTHPKMLPGATTLAVMAGQGWKQTPNPRHRTQGTQWGGLEMESQVLDRQVIERESGNSRDGYLEEVHGETDRHN
jgi:hypothetical protein